MDTFLYYALTVIESVLGVVGIRALSEQPRYAVIERLDRGVEVRTYDARLAVETDARGQGDGEAFGRLFRYITGANRGGGRIAMTAPIEVGRRRIAMTVPVEQCTGDTMRFYLPRAVAAEGAPEPTEAGVRLVHIPAERMAALRFSGGATPEARTEQGRILGEVLAASRKAIGPIVLLGYDPPSRSRSCGATRSRCGCLPTDCRLPRSVVARVNLGPPVEIRRTASRTFRSFKFVGRLLHSGRTCSSISARVG